MGKAQKIILGAALAAGLSLAAPAVAAQQPADGAPRDALDIAFTYAAQHSNTTAGNSFWLQGGNAQIAETFYHGLGAVANITATHASNIQSAGVNLTLVSATFGLRYAENLPAYKSSRRRLRAFGEALGGVANGTSSVFPASGGAQSSAEGAALQLGGGVDLTLRRQIALRLLQADWLHTWMPNGTTGAQNNLTAGAGIVFRFSK